MKLRHPAVLVICIGLFAAAVYAPALPGGWIYDDHFLIPNNPYVHSMEYWPRWFVTDFWDIGDEYALFGQRIAYWRPVITATYALDWQISGGSPAWFHVMNMVWHAIVAGLAFLVLRRWTGAIWPAFVGALLFAAHPTKAESVAWISGRTDVICMVAVLLASQGIARRLRGEKGGLLLEFAGTLLAYTTKEQAIVLPVFAAVEGWVAAGRPAINRSTLLRAVRTAAPQLVIAIAYLVVRKLVMPLEVPAATLSKVPLVDHALIVFESLGRFIALTFVPQNLTIQHGLVHAVDGVPLHSTFYVATGIVGLTGLLALAVVARKRAPLVTVGIAFYLATLTPTMNIKNTQLETLISERFLFLPMLGIALAVGAVLVQWPRRWLFAVCAALIALTAARATLRAADYADENDFWARELEMNPDSVEARRGRARTAIRERRYGAALVDTLEVTQKRPDAGEDVAVAAMAVQLLSDLTPDHARADLEAIDNFCHAMLSRTPVAKLALRGLVFSIRTDTKIFESKMGYYGVRLLVLRSSLRSRLGDDLSAVALAKDALEKCPLCVTTVVGAAMALARAGSYDDARAVLDSARGHMPDSAIDSIQKLVEKSRSEYEQSLAATGPVQLERRAAALATLELWGRAFDVLAPYKDQIKQAPKFAIGFAELAYRAGEPQLAREVLASVKPPDEIERSLAAWARTMGWDYELAPVEASQ